MPNETQYDIAASSPASTRTDLHVDRACPKPGRRRAGNGSAATPTRMAGDPGDYDGLLPFARPAPPTPSAAWTAPTRALPAIGNASAFDLEDARLQAGAAIAELDRRRLLGPGVLSKNSDNSSATLYSILDQLETVHDENDMYELKLKYPGQPDVHWKQSVNPVSGDSLLTSTSNM